MTKNTMGTKLENVDNIYRRKIEKRLSDMACNPDFVQLSSISVSAPGRLPWRIWWGDSCAYMLSLQLISFGIFIAATVTRLHNKA